jgi:nitrile hydratase subunit alpha
MSTHDHDHDHDHDAHNAPESGPALRVKALEALLTEKGIVNAQALDELVDTMEHRVGPHIGARIVAHAWADAAYRKRLLTQPDAAIAELGVDTHALGTHMMVLENTPRVHNMVVCTLCSCYPISVLGLPPVWYKSTAYRARAVSDPRGVLHDFGLSLADDVEIRVWDSSAELRFLVLPERPAGTEHMSEEELAALITRDSMIGTGIVTYPTKTVATEGKSAASEHDG